MKGFNRRMYHFAVIGTNFVTDWLLEAAREVEDVRLLAVFSRTQERGRAYAAQYGAERVYTELSALAADPDIDFVYIASPNICHRDQTIALLNAGKSVLCEKPIAPDCESLDAMCEAAQRNGCVLMEAMVPVHLPCWQTLRRTLLEIAPVRRASLSFCQYSSRYDKFKAGMEINAFRPELCNGSLMDLGVYCLAAAQVIFGAPDSVRASMFRLPGSIDGAGSITLTYTKNDPLTAGGAIADIQYSKISQGQTPSEIQGEGGSLLIDSITRPAAWTLLPRSGRRPDGLSVRAADNTEPRVLDVKPFLHPMAYELRDFVRQLDGAKEPRFLADSRAVLCVMDEARRQTGLDFSKA